MSRRRLIVLGGLFVVAAFVGAVFAPNNASALRTLDQVNGLYPGGIGEFNRIDRQLYNNVAGCISAGGSYRACVNGDRGGFDQGAYVDNAWVSLAGQPSATTVEVNAGQQSIALQLNTMIFVGNTLVRNGNTNPATDCRLHNSLVAGNSIDALPGSIGGSCRQPAKTGANFRIEPRGLYASDNFLLVQNVESQEFDARRSESTRYWTGQTARFRLEGEFTSSRDVWIVLKYRNISAYHATPPSSSAEYRCMQSNGSTMTVRSFRDFNTRCAVSTQSFRIRVNVRANPARVTPSVSLSPSTVGIGDTITDRVTFRNTGTAPVSVAYRYELVAYTSGNVAVSRLARGDTGPGGFWNISNIAAGATAVVNPNWSQDWTNIIRNGNRAMPGSINDLIHNTSKVCVNLWRSGVNLTPAGAVNIPGDLLQQCVTVAKAPALTVTGGDLRIGGSFASGGGSACTLPQNPTSDYDPYGVLMYQFDGTRGSLGRYAATTPGLMSYYGSKGEPYTSSGNGWRSLLFGTNGWRGYVGDGLYFGQTAGINTGTASYCLPNMASYTTGSGVQSIGPSAGVSNPTLDNSVTYNFTGSNGLLELSQLSGVDLPAGKRVVIRVSENSGASGNKIVIRGPIRYQAAGYTSIAQLPQFVLVADGDIDIHFDGDPAIHEFQMSGIISTKGNVYTCENVDGDSDSTALTWAGKCSTRLVVNGVVIAAGRVLPFRTFGFERPADTNTYAEEFSLTPEILLGDYARSRSGAGLSVDYITELPPRY